MGICVHGDGHLCIKGWASVYQGDGHLCIKGILAPVVLVTGLERIEAIMDGGGTRVSTCVLRGWWPRGCWSQGLAGLGDGILSVKIPLHRVVYGMTLWEAMVLYGQVVGGLGTRAFHLASLLLAAWGAWATGVGRGTTRVLQRRWSGDGG